MSRNHEVVKKRRRRQAYLRRLKAREKAKPKSPRPVVAAPAA